MEKERGFSRLQAGQDAEQAQELLKEASSEGLSKVEFWVWGLGWFRVIYGELIGVIQGIYTDNGKEKWNCCLGFGAWGSLGLRMQGRCWVAFKEKWWNDHGEREQNVGGCAGSLHERVFKVSG